jgi:hypothetical protein
MTHPARIPGRISENEEAHLPVLHLLDFAKKPHESSSYHNNHAQMSGHRANSFGASKLKRDVESGAVLQYTIRSESRQTTPAS